MSTKRINRRSFLKGTVIGGIGLTLAACAPAAAPQAPAGEPAEGGEEAAAPSQEVVTVRFMSRAGADNIPTYERVIQEDFESQHPNIKVSIEPAPDDWEVKLLAQIVSGTAVDLFQAWGNIFYNWTQRDLILDVQPYVEADLTAEQVADYNDFQWEGLFMQGKRVGMPKYINVMTVTINKDHFDQYGIEYPPEDGEWDHDDWAEMARALTEAARAEGEQNRWGCWLPAWNWDRFWYHIDMFGGSVVDQKYGTQCMLDSEESQQALQWMYDMIWTNNWFAQPAQVENRWFREAMNPGFISMADSGTYPIVSDRDFEGNVRWDMRHVPKGPTGTRKVLGTTDAWSITQQTPHPAESWALLSFLSGPVFQRKAVVQQEGIIPVLKSLIADFIDLVREARPSLNDVRLETITEILDWGYAEDTFWFKDQNAAAEIIRPALEKVFMVGDVGPEYFIEIAQQVNESQMES